MLRTPNDKMLPTVVMGLALLALIIVLPYYLMFMSGRARLVSSIPGPIPLPFIGNALEIGMNGVDLLRNLTRFRKKYGPISRLWFGPYLFVTVADPKHAEIFLTSKTNIKKSMQYRFLKDLAGDGLVTASGDKWRSDRKLLNPAFNYKILEEFLSVFNSHASILTQKLEKEVGGSEFDIQEYSSLCSLDISCETTMGVRMSIQDNKNNDYLQALSSVEDCIIKRSIQPWLFPDFIFNLTTLSKKHKSFLTFINETTKKIIQRKKKEFSLKENESEKVEHENGFGHKTTCALIDLLLQHERDGYLTDKNVVDQVDTVLIAGHAAFALSISFCMWSLANHQQCQEKAYEEQNAIFGDSNREATTEDLHDMKYLETVIKETMRLYPAAPIILRELEEEVQFDGCTLLPGTTIALGLYFIHRHPDHFPEPEKFDPDRFSPEKAKGRHPYAYVPFSAGPRNCIGQKYAMIGLKCVISTVLRAYKLLPGTTEALLTADIAIKSITGLHLKLEKRKLAFT